MFFEQVSGTLAFHNANETVFEQQLEMTMYEIVAHTPDTTRADQIRVTCPQCGAVNAALKLEAVSYTHLDVYKRQEPKSGASANSAIPAQRIYLIICD